MVCKKCGAPLSKGSLFCSRCGAKAENPPAVPSSGNGWFAPAATLEDRVPDTHVVAPITPHSVSSGASNEERICRKCGAKISVGSSFCSKCGFDSSSEKAAGFTSSDRFASAGEFVKKHKKLLLISAAVCLTLVIVIALFFIGGPKSEKEIMEDIGEDITVLVLDNERIRLHIESLKIDKRKTKDGLDQVYCKIELANDNIAVTSYQLITYSKYNGNKWIYESASPYLPETIEIMKPTPAMYDHVVGQIDGRNSLLDNFSGMIDNCNVTCSGSTVEYTFDVSKTVGVMNTAGTIYATSEVAGDRAGGYYMRTSVDDSNLSVNWNVEGTWSGHETNYGTGWYELTITVNSLTPDAVHCSWEYDGYEDWRKHTYYGDGNDCWIIESNDEYIKIGVRYGTALIGSSLYVYFYTDGTAQVEFPFVGVGNMQKS